MPVNDSKSDEACELLLASQCDCMTVHDNRGRVRVVTRTGRSLGAIVSLEDYDRLKRSDADRMALEQQGDGLDAARGMLVGTLAGGILLVALIFGAFHVGRRYERNRFLDAIDARATRTAIVPLDP